jgi:DNA-3-methyladenine glycosylase
VRDEVEMTTNAAPSQKARRSRLGGPLPASFYDRPTEQVARDLLGAILECRTRDGVAAGRIVETEAYVGEHDLACHAAAGLTARTAPLYGPPGIAYVYFIYGMHWCFNAVTRAKGEPSAVLVRAIEPVKGIELMRERRGVRRDVDLTNGPAKLCDALGIDGHFNSAVLQRGPLTIRDGSPIPDSRVAITPRIGITRCADWPLRWIVRDSEFVSGKRALSARG